MNKNENVSLLEYLEEDRTLSSVIINELTMLNNVTGERESRPCIIFKEFDYKIREIPNNLNITTKYSAFNLDDSWALVVAVRLGELALNTYMTIYDLNDKKNLKLLKKINKRKQLEVVFYNERLEVKQVITCKENPFYKNLNVILNEVEKFEFTEERKNRFFELKRKVMQKFNSDARVFFDSI